MLTFVYCCRSKPIPGNDKKSASPVVKYQVYEGRTFQDVFSGYYLNGLAEIWANVEIGQLIFSCVRSCFL